MNPAGLMEKARRAAASAKLLCDEGDVDGATNRAYYAMFDAAKAALVWAGVEAEGDAVKTHSGLISVFSRELIKTGHLPVDLGRSLNPAAEIRLVADYTGDGVTLGQARWAVEQAANFVEEIGKFGVKTPPPHNP